MSGILKKVNLICYLVASLAFVYMAYSTADMLTGTDKAYAAAKNSSRIVVTEEIQVNGAPCSIIRDTKTGIYYFVNYEGGVQKL